MPAGTGAGGGVSPIVRFAESTATTSSPNTTSSSFGTIAEMSVTITGLTVGRKLKASFMGGFYHASAAVQTHFALALDGAAEVGDVPWNTTGSNAVFGVALQWAWTITATSHTVTARWSVASGQLNNFGLSRKLLLEELLTA